MITVFLAIARIAPRRLDMPVCSEADPDVGVGGRNRQLSKFSRGCAHRAPFPVGAFVTEAATRFWPANPWFFVRDIEVRRSLLFQVFSQRYERGSTILTSNLPFDEWTGVFASERLTGALLDRLTHHVHILEMNGDSYRLKQSKQRQRKT